MVELKKTGVIVLAHGTKLQNADEVLYPIIKIIKKKFCLENVLPAYLQFSRNNLSNSINKLITAGCKTIIIIPFFLFNGNHVTRDIPRMIKKERVKYSKIKFIYTKPLGKDKRISEIVVDRLDEVIHTSPIYSRMSIITNPKEIENRSLQLIDKYLTTKLPTSLPHLQKEIVKRVIHATCDFSYAKQLIFHKNAIKSGLSAIKSGKNIIVDVEMVKSGINKSIVANFGCKVICVNNDKDIVQQSRKLNITRAILSMRKSAKFMKDGIVVIGNSPTALFELCRLVKAKKAKPALIVGVPVGFVGAVESKRQLTKLSIPYITNKGRKGGSAVAVAIVNALLKTTGESTE